MDVRKQGPLWYLVGADGKVLKAHRRRAVVDGERERLEKVARIGAVPFQSAPVPPAPVN